MTLRFECFFDYDNTESNRLMVETDSLPVALIRIGELAKQYQSVTKKIQVGIFSHAEQKLIGLVAEERGLYSAVREIISNEASVVNNSNKIKVVDLIKRLQELRDEVNDDDLEVYVEGLWSVGDKAVKGNYSLEMYDRVKTVLRDNEIVELRKEIERLKGKEL